jgi:hypothetical protein
VGNEPHRSPRYDASFIARRLASLGRVIDTEDHPDAEFGLARVAGDDGERSDPVLGRGRFALRRRRDHGLVFDGAELTDGDGRVFRGAALGIGRELECHLRRFAAPNREDGTEEEPPRLTHERPRVS